jgi:hypothetical protein
LHMRPLAHGMAALVAGFQHGRFQTLLYSMGRSGEPDRSRADDCDFPSCICLSPLTCALCRQGSPGGGHARPPERNWARARCQPP